MLVAIAVLILVRLNAGQQKSSDNTQSRPVSSAVKSGSSSKQPPKDNSSTANESKPVSEPEKAPEQAGSSTPAKPSSSASAVPQPTVPVPDTMPKQDISSPALSAQARAYLNSLSNKRDGYGWKGAENRQSYYSQYNAYSVGDRTKKCVYLTFDEGYENGYTPKILDVLKEKNVKAVFFITMDYLKTHPELVKRMIDEGHTVGNHSVTHPDMTTKDIDSAYKEIKGLHDAVKERFGYEMNLFRFPTGANSPRMLALVNCVGYKSVFWNFAHRDWDPKNQPSVEETKSLIMKYLNNGTLYLLHAVSSADTSALPDVIDSIRANGYTIELFK